MKSIKILAASIILAALAACGGQAKAAQLPDNFVASDGRVFQTVNEVSVQFVSGAVLVKQMSGSVQSFPDPTGSVSAKVLASPDFAKRHVQAPATPGLYVNTAVSTEISCQSSQTVIGYGYSLTPTSVFADGCQLWQAIKAVSN